MSDDLGRDLCRVFLLATVGWLAFDIAIAIAEARPTSAILAAIFTANAIYAWRLMRVR